MIKTKDEILRLFAGILDDLPPPPIPTFKPQEPMKPEDFEKKFPNTQKFLEEEGEKPKPIMPIPLPVPQPKAPQPDEPEPVPEKQEAPPMSEPLQVPNVQEVNNDWAEPDAGSPEWAAENYPYAYLFGHAPFMGYISDRSNDPVTKALMDKIVNEAPEKYFEWGLYRLENKALKRLKGDWAMKAAEALVDGNPHYAAILGFFEDAEYQRDSTLLPRLWTNVINAEMNRSMTSTSGRLFPGMLFYRMKRLMKMLKESHPDFYAENIAGRPIEGKFSQQADPLASPRTKSKPLSKRDERDWPWDTPEPGTGEWLAEYYPHTYLRGQDTKSKGYMREFQDPDIIKPLMDKIVATDPVKYFEWNLRRVGDKGGRTNLKEWLRPAIKSLIEKSPYEALMFKVFKHREAESYLDELWSGLLEVGKGRESQGEDAFPGRVFNEMRSLAGFIANSRPDFYNKHIAKSRFATQEFNDRARQMSRD